MTISPPPMPTRIRTMEYISACGMLAFGIILAMPGATFMNSEAYRAFAMIASEERWATVCITIGLFRLAALWVNGNWRRSPILRGITSIMGVMIWTLCMALIMHASLPGPAGSLALFGMALTIDLISAWRSGRDYIETERAYGRPI